MWKEYRLSMLHYSVHTAGALNNQNFDINLLKDTSRA